MLKHGWLVPLDDRVCCICTAFGVFPACVLVSGNRDETQAIVNRLLQVSLGKW